MAFWSNKRKSYGRSLQSSSDFNFDTSLDSLVSSIELSSNAGLDSSLRNIIVSTANPSGGNDGDVWLTYTP